jgi:PilZ domain-containing protein
MSMRSCASVRVVYEGGEAVDFEALDVRPTGAFLPSDLMYEHGSTLSLEMRLPGIGCTTLRAEVVTVDFAGHTTGRPGMGIVFRGLASAERQALRRLGR